MTVGTCANSSGASRPPIATGASWSDRRSPPSTHTTSPSAGSRRRRTASSRAAASRPAWIAKRAQVGRLHDLRRRGEPLGDRVEHVGQPAVGRVHPCRRGHRARRPPARPSRRCRRRPVAGSRPGAAARRAGGAHRPRARCRAHPWPWRRSCAPRRGSRRRAPGRSCPPVARCAEYSAWLTTMTSASSARSRATSAKHSSPTRSAVRPGHSFGPHVTARHDAGATTSPRSATSPVGESAANCVRRSRSAAKSGPGRSSKSASPGLGRVEAREAQVVRPSLHAARSRTMTPACSWRCGRSLRHSWSWSASVAVATTARRPDARTGARYARLFPDPVGASARRWWRSSIAAGDGRRECPAAPVDRHHRAPPRPRSRTSIGLAAIRPVRGPLTRRGYRREAVRPSTRAPRNRVPGRRGERR